jgi:hypothetical protein
MKSELNSRDKGKIDVGIWYAYGRTQGLTKTGKKIVTPTFSQFPRFLIVNDETAFFCNGYGIYFNNDSCTNELFFESDHFLAREENLGLVQKILNSSIMHYYVSKTSVSIEGNYPCYQKNFIERFTIPELNYREIEELKQLTDKKEIDEFLIEKYQLDNSIWRETMSINIQQIWDESAEIETAY